MVPYLTNTLNVAMEGNNEESYKTFQTDGDYKSTTTVWVCPC